MQTATPFPGAISLIEPIAAGNALRLFMTPAHRATHWRLLRRPQDAFTGPDDPGALCIAEGADAVALDTTALENDVPYFYRLYCWQGDTLIGEGSPTASASPAATYARYHGDPQVVLRERLELGLAVEVQRGVLHPQTGSIMVFTAPMILAEDVVFPSVVVHMDQATPSERFIGDLLGESAWADGAIGEDIGQLTEFSLSVTSVSLNPDERITLRQVIHNIVQANAPIWAANNMLQPSFSQRDLEDTGQYSAPLYMTQGTFTCLSPTFVSEPAPPISDVVLRPRIHPAHFEVSFHD